MKEYKNKIKDNRDIGGERYIGIWNIYRERGNRE
jgi:hypothetical protein